MLLRSKSEQCLNDLVAQANVAHQERSVDYGYGARATCQVPYCTSECPTVSRTAKTLSFQPSFLQERTVLSTMIHPNFQLCDTSEPFLSLFQDSFNIEIVIHDRPSRRKQLQYFPSDIWQTVANSYNISHLIFGKRSILPSIYRQCKTTHRVTLTHPSQRLVCCY
jgi:hypothetical protein